MILKKPVPLHFDSLKTCLSESWTMTVPQVNLTSPIEKLADVLRDFGTEKMFSAIDLKSGYWQIPFEEESKHLTTFATRDGATYQYNAMPFGLKNTPAAFQKLMTRGYLEKFTHVYLDDIIIFSKDHQEHLRHLQQVFERL